MKSSLEEKTLLYKVQTEQSADAFAVLYDRHAKSIYRFVYFKLSHQQEAEDVTGNIFLKCWQYLMSVKGKEIRNFKSLLYTIARHEVIDVYRERAKRKECSVHSIGDVSDGGNTKARFEVNEDVGRLLVAIKKLKQEYQEVVLFRYVEEFSIPEIALIMGKNQINVRVTLHRALKKLQEFSSTL